MLTPSLTWYSMAPMENRAPSGRPAPPMASDMATQAVGAKAPVGHFIWVAGRCLLSQIISAVRPSDARAASTTPALPPRSLVEAGRLGAPQMRDVPESQAHGGGHIAILGRRMAHRGDDAGAGQPLHQRLGARKLGRQGHDAQDVAVLQPQAGGAVIGRADAGSVLGALLRQAEVGPFDVGAQHPRARMRGRPSSWRQKPRQPSRCGYGRRGQGGQQAGDAAAGILGGDGLVCLVGTAR